MATSFRASNVNCLWDNNWLLLNERNQISFPHYLTTSQNLSFWSLVHVQYYRLTKFDRWWTNWIYLLRLRLREHLKMYIKPSLRTTCNMYIKFISLHDIMLRFFIQLVAETKSYYNLKFSFVISNYLNFWVLVVSWSWRGGTEMHFDSIGSIETSWRIVDWNISLGLRHIYESELNFSHYRSEWVLKLCLPNVR